MVSAPEPIRRPPKRCSVGDWGISLRATIQGLFKQSIREMVCTDFLQQWSLRAGVRLLAREADLEDRVARSERLEEDRDSSSRPCRKPSE